MSSVKLMATMKTCPDVMHRRRRYEKQQRVLELPNCSASTVQPDVVPYWDAAPPITPPAAFLPPGYKKGFTIINY